MKIFIDSQLIQGADNSYEIPLKRKIGLKLARLGSSKSRTDLETAFFSKLSEK